MGKVKVTKKKEYIVILTYLTQPMTLKKLGDMCGLCQPVLSSILKKYNIPIYTKNQIYNPNLVENYFENIDSEKKAYFLGLIIADGNVFDPGDNGNRSKSISITLKDEDTYMLEAFKSELNSKTSVNPDGRGSSMIAVRSNKMADDLSKYGIIPNKSLHTTMPNIREDLYPHLIRGILDGDGCVQAKNGNRRFKHALGFCGTEELMTSIRDMLVDKLKVYNVSVYTYSSRPLSMVTWGGKDDILKIYNYLYTNSNIHLRRKFLKCRKILEFYDMI